MPARERRLRPQARAAPARVDEYGVERSLGHGGKYFQARGHNAIANPIQSNGVRMVYEPIKDKSVDYYYERFLQENEKAWLTNRCATYVKQKCMKTRWIQALSLKRNIDDVVSNSTLQHESSDGLV